jgi:hypothetical protein
MMSEFLLLIFILECIILLVWGLLKPERMYYFPFMAAAVFSGWILPQCIGWFNSIEILPKGSFEKTIFMTILCLGSCYLGFILNHKSMLAFNWSFNEKRLLQGSAILSLLGAYFFFKVSQISGTVTEIHGGAWTGIITIYVFFSKLLTFGFVIAVLIYLKNTTNKFALGIILFDCMFYFDRIVLQGRRADIAGFFIIIMFALWFQRKVLIPRWMMLVAIIFGSLIINSIGNYRSIVMSKEGGNWSEVLNIDFVGNLKQLSESGGYEIENTIYNIEAVDRTMNLDYGLSLWNNLVFQYVPAQFVGVDVKQSLMFSLEDITYSEFNYISKLGTTHTGMSDAFASFWYFGAVKFFLIAYIFSLLYNAAIRGHFIAQLLVILTLVPALHAITHTTHSYFGIWPVTIIFLAPVLIFARSHRRTKFKTKNMEYRKACKPHYFTFKLNKLN